MTTRLRIEEKRDVALDCFLDGVMECHEDRSCAECRRQEEMRQNLWLDEGRRWSDRSPKKVAVPVGLARK